MNRTTPRSRAAGGISLVALFLIAISAQATTPKEIVVFGESTSDVGNMYILFESWWGSQADNPWFTSGRIGNGPNWTDYLASHYKHVLGMGPSRAGGSNYATGGADTTFGSGVNGFGSTGQQVTEYLGDNPSVSGRGEKLFVFWAGANDLLADPTDASVPVGNIATQIGMLFDAGARHFLVLNMLPIGLTPDGMSGGQFNPLPVPSSVLNEISVAFNQELLAALGNFKCENPAAHFYVLDVHQLYLDVLANPGVYGFLNITDRSLYTGDDPNTSLWWDGVHTTTRFNALIGERAANLVDHHGGGLRCKAP